MSPPCDDIIKDWQVTDGTELCFMLLQVIRDVIEEEP